MTAPKNYMGLDIGTLQKVYFDRSKMAPTLTPDPANPTAANLPQHVGQVIGFYRSGTPEKELKPAKDLQLWTVQFADGFHFRVDTLIAAVRLPDQEVPPPAPLEGEFLAGDQQDLVH